MFGIQSLKIRTNYMCYSYEVSLATFIIGSVFTIINIYTFYDDPVYLYLTVGWWLGAVLMQLWETLIWKNYECILISKLALVNNLLQPLLFAAIVLLPGYAKKHRINMNYLLVVLSIYTLYVSRFLLTDYGCIKTSDGVRLKWWDLTGGIVYVTTFTLVGIITLEKAIAISFLVLFWGSLIASSVFYAYNDVRPFSLVNIIQRILLDPSRIGSIWCWVAGFSNLFNYVAFKFII